MSEVRRKKELFPLLYHWLLLVVLVAPAQLGWVETASFRAVGGGRRSLCVLGSDYPVIGGPDNPVDRIIRQSVKISGHPSVREPSAPFLFLSRFLGSIG